jgi:hypothetical protein
MAGFVDTHSHMVPSGDDGVRSVDEGVELVAEAGRRGTAVQYATPHAVHRHPFTEQRRRKVMAAREQMRARLANSVDFRIGWEISPEPWVLEADPSEMAMEGLHACLLELPLPHTRPSSLDLFVQSWFRNGSESELRKRDTSGRLTAVPPSAMATFSTSARGLSTSASGTSRIYPVSTTLGC